MSACRICGSQVSFNDSFTLKRCYHTFCQKCLHDYIRKKLGSQIKCPYHSCDQNIPDQIIRKCLSNDQTKLYDNLSILASSNTFKKCLTKNCPKIVSVTNCDIIFQCTYCEQPNCLRCQMRHYPNDCGRNNLNENDIDFSANEAMRRRKREALEELFKIDKYIESPESFECPLCCSFVLPRVGIMLRQCYHSFCKDCFHKHMKGAKNIGMLKCPSCKMEIDDREVIKAIGAIELKDMICKLVSPKLFSCKTANCIGLWDGSDSKSEFRCSICKKKNCLDCEDVHEGMTCDSFRQTRRYQDSMRMKNITNKSVKCICGKLLIQQGGCAALKCDNCFRHICAFTGKIAGDKGPGSCECSTRKTCHPKCIYGCFPE